MSEHARTHARTHSLAPFNDGIVVVACSGVCSWTSIVIQARASSAYVSGLFMKAVMRLSTNNKVGATSSGGWWHLHCRLVKQ